MDFSAYPDSGRYYAGSERKKGVIMPDGSCYMIKFQKATAFGKRFNHVSEYLGSHIFELAGIPAQSTYLGTFGDESVVACRDFNTSEAQFVPFNDIGESTLEEDKESYQYEYADIMRMLHDNSKLTHEVETIELFWRMYVVDALIGNFDRHGANWGFVKKNNAYAMAPVFDNGSCLFPNLVDDDAILEVLKDEDEMVKRVYGFPTSQIKLRGKKSSYSQIIASGLFPECNDALRFVMEHIAQGEMEELVDGIAGISEVRHDFYQRMLSLRYELILQKSHQALLRGEL